jgi:acyl-CoA thioester hydrolase
MTSTEYVVSTIPFVIRRRVKWGECDPAGVVYTTWFTEYVLTATELFYGGLLGGTPDRMKEKFGIFTPTRALAFDFRKTMRPDDEFDMTVSLREIRTRSYVLAIDGRTQEHEVFQSLLTAVCISRGALSSVEIPAVMRAALEQYRHRCTAATSV